MKKLFLVLMGVGLLAVQGVAMAQGVVRTDVQYNMLKEEVQELEDRVSDMDNVWGWNIAGINAAYLGIAAAILVIGGFIFHYSNENALKLLKRDIEEKLNNDIEDQNNKMQKQSEEISQMSKKLTIQEGNIMSNLDQYSSEQKEELKKKEKELLERLHNTEETSALTMIFSRDSDAILNTLKSYHVLNRLKHMEDHVSRFLKNTIDFILDLKEDKVDVFPDDQLGKMKSILNKLKSVYSKEVAKICENFVERIDKLTSSKKSSKKTPPKQGL